MNGETVDFVVKNGLCCSCGVCAGACPFGSITMGLTKDGFLYPSVHTDTCKSCGLCVKVCPGKQSFEEVIKGNFYEDGEPIAYNGHTKNEELLKHSASGGVCSQLIDSLLKIGGGVALVVNTWDFSKAVTTEVCTEISPSMGGSRYISVSHENGIKYLLSHREEKMIFVGTGCAIRGVLNVIKAYHLPRENYLLIGLFCDKTMTYRVWDYFALRLRREGKLQELYFRSKKKSGWPGDMLLVCENKEFDFPKGERQKVKDFFANERCLYCVDKLACCADISLGDNYTQTFVNKKGTSTILLRTELGKKYFQSFKDQFELQPTDMESVKKAQEIAKIKERVQFAHIKIHSKKKIPRKIKWKYFYKKLKIFAGKHRRILNVMLWVDGKIKR